MNLLKRIVKSEAGQALPMALILLVLGGLLVVPTLDLMTTNLNANRQIDRKNLELYSADAGVEKVLWNMQYNDTFPLPGNGEEIEAFSDFSINDGRTVDVKISKESGQPYKITSTATSTDGHNTTIECYCRHSSDFTWLCDSAITSADNVYIRPGCSVSGNVTYAGDLTNQGTIDGGVIQDPTLPARWPTADQLIDFYSEQMAGAPTYPAGTTINIGGRTEADPYPIPESLALGDLTITGNGVARLEGILYIKGKLTVMPNCTINLNSETIFSEFYVDCRDVNDSITFQPGCTLMGSGCIIAVGGIDFRPSLGPGDRLIGVTDLTTNNSAPKDTFVLSKFQADSSGDVVFFRVKCPDTVVSGEVKVAMYSANGENGGPGDLIEAVNDGTSVVAGWNNIAFPKTYIVAGTAYWLAAKSKQDNVIGIHNQQSVNRWKLHSYSSELPSPAGAGFTEQEAQQYLFAGHTEPFVFIMSILCKSQISPIGNLYGSVAGNTEVYLAPGNTLVWTPPPEGEGTLNFPGFGDNPAGGGGQNTQILTYTIK